MIRHVVADDLTGALDSAVHLGPEAGVRVTFPPLPPWQDSTPPESVQAHDTESRALEAAAAGRAVAAACAGLGPGVFKKVDSTLRGHVEVEITAACQALRRRTAILAPSLPGQGRTVSGGLLFSRDRGAVDIRSLLAGPTAHIGLEQLRAGGDLRLDRAGTIVMDAVTDSDLDLIVALCAAHPDLLPVGSAGLAAAFGRRAGTRRLPPPQRRSPAVLVVVGSINPVALAQAEAVRAAALPGITVLVPAAGGFEPLRVAQVLAARAVDALLRLPAETAIVATGGDTAMAVCRALSASALRARGEILPGAVWSTVEGTDQIFVTKAGGFGEEDALLRVAANLLGMEQGSG